MGTLGGGLKRGGGDAGKEAEKNIELNKKKSIKNSMTIVEQVSLW